jgi:hypothetical protein
VTPRQFAITQFLAAFALTAAGLCAAVSIAWRFECRAIEKALTLGGAK